MIARDDRADDLAWFVVVVGISPTEYRALTRRERTAIIEMHREVNRGR